MFSRDEEVGVGYDQNILDICMTFSKNEMLKCNICTEHFNTRLNGRGINNNQKNLKIVRLYRLEIVRYV